jgi:hypothetical protein
VPNANPGRTPANAFIEPGVTDIPSSELIDPDFWDPFMKLVIARLNPKRKYGLLIQPRSYSATITLVTSVVTDASATEDWFKDHFNPILQRMEDDYDDFFDLDTRIKIRDIGPLETTTSIPTPTPTPPTTTKKRATKNSDNLQAMQVLTDAILKSNQDQTNAILEAIKVQNTSQPSINWTPLVQAVATAIPAVLGVPVQPTPTPAVTSSPVQQQPAAQPPLEVGVIQALQAKITKLDSKLNQLDTKVDKIASTQYLLVQTQAQLTSTVNNIGQILAVITSTKPSNDSGSSSNPPATPAAPSTSSAPSTPTTPSAPASSSAPLASPSTEAMITRETQKPKPSLPEITPAEPFKGE